MENEERPIRTEGIGKKRRVYTISVLCVVCRACVGACPANCISWGYDRYEIDPNECRGCGICAMTCPVGAPIPAEE